MLKLKRAYEKATKDDGERILVERLWPRGVTKAQAKLDSWLKEIAPSPDLRKWYGHDPEKWEEFRRRYYGELKKRRDLVDLIKQKGRTGTVTLVYAARDEERNSALALKEFIEKRVEMA
jgi:uncharacterized protein YeaO (DUF488 family)